MDVIEAVKVDYTDFLRSYRFILYWLIMLYILSHNKLVNSFLKSIKTSLSILPWSTPSQKTRLFCNESANREFPA